MISSPGFGSNTWRKRSPYSDSLSLCLRPLSGLKLRHCIYSPDNSSIGTRSFRFASELSLLVSRQFQVLFHWVSHPSFRLSLTVLVHYRYARVFSLGWWSTRIPTRYLPHGTWEIGFECTLVSLTRLSLSLVGYSTPFNYLHAIPQHIPQPLLVLLAKHNRV